MNLWTSSQFLLLGLFLCSSALTPEECQPLTTPLSLVDSQVIYGRVNSIAGFADNELFVDLMKKSDSSWLKITASPSNASEAVMYEENRINGKCFAATYNMTIDGNTATAAAPGIDMEFQVLPSCEGCLVISVVNCTIRGVQEMLRFMNINSTVGEDVVSVRGAYLMAREATVKDSDLEQFKQQASCLGLSGEPHFIHDPEKAVCAEGEAVMMPLS